METVTFTARSVPEAIRCIKAQLGADAMILSTRKLSHSLRDPYNPNRFEVVAAPCAQKSDPDTRGGRQNPKKSRPPKATSKEAGTWPRGTTGPNAEDASTARPWPR